MKLKQNISLAIGKTWSLVLLIALPLTGAAQLTVYPGDANNNGRCSHVDVLYIGLAHGTTGPARGNASISWVPQILQTSWNQATIDGVNYGYLDCDGSGTIDSLDVSAIDLNFGLTVTPSAPVDTSSTVGGNAPVLSITLPQDSLPVQGTVTFVANIDLGNFLLPANGIYGVAFTISYDASIVDQVIPDPHGGWLTSNTVGLNRAWVDSVNGLIYMVITNIDQQNRSGAGTIASIGIVMDDNIRVSGAYNLGLEFVQVRALASNGTAFIVNPIGDEMLILTSASSPQPDIEIEMGPNPVRDQLRVSVPETEVTELKLLDISGQTVRAFPPGILDRRLLALDDLPAGIYFLELKTGKGIYRKKLLRVP